MTKIVAIYSEEKVKDTTEADLIFLAKNSEGMPYVYLPFVKKHMSLTKEELEDYKKGKFGEGLTEITSEQLRKIRNV